MQELQPILRPGARVDARGEPWRVIDVEADDRVTLVTLRGVGAGNVGETARLLTPFDRLTPLDGDGRLRARSRRTVLRTALRAVAEQAPWTQCWTASTAEIEIRAWQLEPACAALEGTTRILLADEVGLGKTIQALLIASELAARGFARRILILTPAPLRDQWADELSRRFAQHASVFDHEALAALASTLPPGVNPWDTAPFIISSIDLAKRAETRQALDAAFFDLLIVDEAHHLTPGSDRAALVAALAARTPFIVLATATPHSGDTEAYRFLCRVGDVTGSDDMRVFRRRAHDVRDHRARRVRSVHVLPTEAEQRMLDAALAYASAVWRDAGAGHGRLAASVIARRACSSALAAHHTIARRLALLDGAADHDDHPRLPWEDDAPDAAVPDAILGCPGLADPATERTWLEQLREHTAAAAHAPSKLRALRRLIARTRESVLVFSEYRDVVEWCARGLADLAPVAVLHGGLSPSMRRLVIGQFNDGVIRVLVATDAAGEGLNLHARCRLVVNLELPWSPLRLDQRAGRVDRIGQTRRVHVRHLVHRGSYEDHVLARLERRRRTAADDLEATALSEEAVASAILEGAPLPMASAPAPSAPTDHTTAAAVVQRARRLRTLAGTHASHTASSVFAVRTAVSPARHLMLLFAADCQDGDGRPVQTQLVALAVALSPSCRRVSRPFIAMASAHPSVQSALQEVVTAQAATAGRQLSAIAVRLVSRLDGIRAAIDRDSSDRVVQASLFDRREEQRAHAREAVRARWHAHLRERRRAAVALGSITSGPPRLVAAWLDA